VPRQFKQKIENEIVPLLRKQKGFLDEITFLIPKRKKKFMPSVCGRLRNMQRHTTVERIPEVTKILASVVEGTPRVQTYEVLNSTIQRTIAAVAA